jgi:hypothetical protein
MEDILDRCRRNGIELDAKVQQISTLQSEIREIELERTDFAEVGESTIAHDEALEQLRRKQKEAVSQNVNEMD